ncbi:MAG: LytTR family DNA-binding domain-containing protein [Bacteroidia bacterium]|nr:LytTR family DNA-binding domain-containing protein [Bacteroidia bacterium]
MIRCIIVDDEFPARILLKEFIEKVPTLELVGSYKSGLEALPVVQAGGIDLMFLDIQMPDITGVNFLKMLSIQKPLVVFTTAYSEYAIESYQLDVLDYLLKPFSFDRFMQAVSKAMQRVAQREAMTNVHKVTESASQVSAEEEREVGEVSPKSTTAERADEEQEGESPRRQIEGSLTDRVILVKGDHKIIRVRYEEILYISSLRDYVEIHSTTGERYLALMSLRALEESLPVTEFIRVHKSYIVRVDKIRSLFGNQISLDGVEEYIPIGKSYKDYIQTKLFEQG